jgi:DNA-directed RNA polymerase specialized sigma24 family protein
MGAVQLDELESLYRSDYRRFLRVAVAILRDEARAVDAVQDAFASAIRRQRQFRGEGPLEAWVWRMVVNAALKERGRPRHADLSGLEIAAGPEEPTPVAEAIARLPERQRLALFLRYYAAYAHWNPPRMFPALSLMINPGRSSGSTRSAPASPIRAATAFVGGSWG